MPRGGTRASHGGVEREGSEAWIGGDHLLMRHAIEIHAAFVNGDLAGLQRALGDPPAFPDAALPPGVGEHCLEYAIYHSPLAFIRTLLERGADPNYAHAGGFPSLLAALSTDRPDRYEILELLLEHGADVQQRGVNDHTPLHHAAARDDAVAVRLLLARGADPHARTRVDDLATPLEEAERLGCARAARALRPGAGAGEGEPRQGQSPAS